MKILGSGKRLFILAALAVSALSSVGPANAYDHGRQRAYPYPSYFYGTPYWYGAIPGGTLPGVHPEQYPQTTIHTVTYAYTYFYRGQGRCGRYRYWNGYCCIDARWGRPRHHHYDYDRDRDEY